MSLAFTSSQAAIEMNAAGVQDSHLSPKETEYDILSIPSSSHFSIKQRSVSITLDGPTILTLSAALIVVIHSNPDLTKVILAAAPLLLAIHNDYQNFINLGPGGTPATVLGYARILWLSLWTLRDPFKAPEHDPFGVPRHGRLRDLAARQGPRPMVAGIAPQRQLDQTGSEAQYLALRRALHGLAVRLPSRYHVSRSSFEKHGPALFSKRPVNRTKLGEVCHVHDSDHSLHMTLHPDDIREAISKGWAQRHPLAWKGLFGSERVPEGFVMVYAPRDDYELRAVCNIIEAAIWYVSMEEENIEVPSKTQSHNP